MIREKTAGVALTLDEWRELRKKIRQAEDDEDKTYTVSSYIRSKLLLPHLNGQQAPSVPETVPKNVSPVSEDTISNSEQPLTLESKLSKQFEFKDLNQ